MHRSYDDWKTDAPDPGTVEDWCEGCGAQLYPEETELCRDCYHDYLAGLRDNRRDEDAA
jgi:hypothetical protein